MSGLRKHIKQQITVERSKGHFSTCDLYTEILAKLIDDKNRIKELEETLMLAWSYLDPDCHSICWDKCEKLLEGAPQPPQPTHNAPKPHEEGDCIGGEGEGL